MAVDSSSSTSRARTTSGLSIGRRCSGIWRMNQKKQVRGPSLRQAEARGAGKAPEIWPYPASPPLLSGETTKRGSRPLHASYLPGTVVYLHGNLLTTPKVLSTSPCHREGLKHQRVGCLPPIRGTAGPPPTPAPTTASPNTRQAQARSSHCLACIPTVSLCPFYG